MPTPNEQLKTAASKNDFEAMMQAIKNGADVNLVCDDNGSTPAHIIASKDGVTNRGDKIDQLKAKNADFSKRDNKGNLPLHSAIASKQSAHTIISVMNETPKYHLSDHNLDGNTPLHLLAAGDHLNSLAFEKFLALGKESKTIDLNAINNAGQTPLHSALSNNYERAVDLLLACPNVQTNIKDKEQQSPLVVAVKTNNKTLVKKIIERCDDISFQDSEGNTVLHLAAQQGGQVLDILLTHKNIKSILDEKNNAGYTALDEAVNTLNAYTVEALLKHEAHSCDTHPKLEAVKQFVLAEKEKTSSKTKRKDSNELMFARTDSATAAIKKTDDSASSSKTIKFTPEEIASAEKIEKFLKTAMQTYQAQAKKTERDQRKRSKSQSADGDHKLVTKKTSLPLKKSLFGIGGSGSLPPQSSNGNQHKTEKPAAKTDADIPTTNRSMSPPVSPRPAQPDTENNVEPASSTSPTPVRPRPVNRSASQRRAIEITARTGAQLQKGIETIEEAEKALAEKKAKTTANETENTTSIKMQSDNNASTATSGHNNPGFAAGARKYSSSMPSKEAENELVTTPAKTTSTVAAGSSSPKPAAQPSQTLAAGIAQFGAIAKQPPNAPPAPTTTASGAAKKHPPVATPCSYGR